MGTRTYTRPPPSDDMFTPKRHLPTSHTRTAGAKRQIAAGTCARVVAGRYYKGQQISTTLTRFRPLFGLHDRQLRQLSRNLVSVVLICCPFKYHPVTTLAQHGTADGVTRGADCDGRAAGAPRVSSGLTPTNRSGFGLTLTPYICTSRSGSLDPPLYIYIFLSIYLSICRYTYIYIYI